MEVFMNVKYLIGTVIETIVKVVILAAVIIFVFRTATQAYDFGYRVFADEPVSISGGRTITVGIAEDASVKDIAAHHDQILPGIYDLSTDMKAEQMLEIMSTPPEETTENAEDTALPISE